MNALDQRNLPLYLLFCMILMLNIALWFYSRDLRPTWGNVPPVPGIAAAERSTLGDRQLAYRTIGLSLQNLGSIGGHDQLFENYNYERLRDWFFLADKLDHNSNFIPALAAYYYGATKKLSDLTPVIDYLEVVGQRPEPHKWRWLAHAVYLARFQQGDLNRALDLAHKMAALPRNDMPIWTRQMPAFVMNAMGDKQAAYALMMSILANSNVEEMDPAEVRFIRDYVCDRILTPEESAREKLCTATK
jgi:hypothetical protein